MSTGRLPQFPVLHIVISGIEKSLGFEWMAEKLAEKKYKVTFILLNPSESELERYLLNLGYKVIRIKYKSRFDLIPAFIRLFFRFLFQRPDIVHAHLLDSGIAAMPAAFFAGIRKRVYTRHHSSFHHIYHPRFVMVDKMINGFANALIAISGNVRKILLKEGVREDKIHVVHHGFKTELFDKTADHVLIRQKYNPLQKKPVIGVISRYHHLKGIQFIIPAFAEILKAYPDALLVLANARGEFKAEVHKLLNRLPEGSYVEIGFENDLPGLYSLFDVFVHVPVDPQIEAFGQTYIEALAASVPSVFTLSGIAPDFIVHEKNAFVVPFANAAAISQAILRILESAELRQNLIRQGREDVIANFGLDQMMESLYRVYES
jgi:glycosyltransferase involved in cell wall biosynthesis